MLKGKRIQNPYSEEDEIPFVYPPEVLKEMWDQAYPKLSEKLVGKPIIMGTSGGIGGTDIKDFLNHGRQ